MRKLHAARTAAAAAALSAANAAFASGDSGTGSMGEMSLSGGQFAMLLGAVVGLGVVIYVITKFMK